MKLKKSILALALTSICAGVSAAPLQLELQHLLKTHPLIKASDSEIKAASSSVDAARGIFFPRLTVTASTGREKIESQSYLPSETFNLGYSGVGNTQRSSLGGNKVAATLKMPLYHHYNLQYRVNLEEIVAAMARLDRNAIEQELLLDGLTAYMQVARFQLLIELTKINEASTREQLELERKRVEGGGGIQVDELQAKTRLQIVKERTVFYQQGLRDALATYEQVFGKAPNLNAFQMVDINNAKIPNNIQQAISTAIQSSPEVKTAEMNVKRQKERVKIAVSEFGPKIDIVAKKSEDRHKNALAARSDEFIGLEMSWSLSLGQVEKHRADAAKQRLAVSQERSKNVSNQAKEKVIIAYNQVRNGQERFELLKSAAEIAESVMMDRKRLRDAGKETALSALDAEVEYYGVLANKINAEIDTRLGAYRLLAAMGELTAEDLAVFGEFAVPVTPLKNEIKAL